MEWKNITGVRESEFKVIHQEAGVAPVFLKHDNLNIRVGAISKPHVSTPKSFTFVLKSTMNTKKWYLKVNNHPLIGFLVL